MAYKNQNPKCSFYKSYKIAFTLSLLYSFSVYGMTDVETICGLDSLKSFSQKLETEVKKGISVEVVGVVSQNDQLLCKKSLSLTFDLWDEVVRITPFLSTKRSLKLTELKESICHATFCITDEQKVIGKLRFRILLNPLWENRVAKVLQLNPNIEKMQLIRLNAKSIAKELPNEIIIYDKESSF